MRERILSIFLTITLIMSTLTCVSATSAGAAEISDTQIVASDNIEGWLDSVEGGENSVTVRGWAFDGIDTSRYSQIHIYIGGSSSSKTAEGHAILANTSRPDVDDAYGCGDNHGFDATISTEKIGEQPVYVYAISIDEKSHIYLGSRRVTINGEDKIKPEITNAKVPISHSTTFTVSCNATDANLDRVEVCVWYTSDKESSQMKYTPKLDGYYAVCTVPLYDLGKRNGNYTIEITAYDTSDNYDIEKFTFDFYNPIGSVEKCVDNGNSIRLSGWAFDESDITKNIELSVYIGGDAGKGELTTIKADKPHAEADKLYGCGANHGFEAVIPTTQTGYLPVYIYMDNVGSGGITLLQKYWVTISQETEKPVIKSFTAQTGSNSHECILTAEISDNIGMCEVIFEAWNENNYTESPLWCFGTIKDGVVTGTLNLSHLNKGNGKFFIQIRAYDYGFNNDTAQMTYELYNPVGKVDALNGVDGGVNIKGWAFDENDTNKSIEIAVYIGGDVSKGEEHIIVADQLRADIDADYGCGKNHGFSETVKTKLTGENTVFVYAKNIDNGSDVLLYTGSVNIPEPKYELGDANLDGFVDVNDVTHLQMHIAGYKKADNSNLIDTENEEIFRIVNLNDDSYIDISDATYLQMILAGFVL